MNQQSIAVVEDEPSHATLLKYNLEQRGYDVSHYENGKSFLEDSSTKRFRLIIINAQISDINGLELKSKIREKKMASPILFLTTGKIEEKRRWGTADIEFLGKPFKITSLMNKVEKLVKKPTLVRIPFKSEPTEVIHWF